MSAYLPALMSVGAGLGVALHTVLTSWGNMISVGQVPRLRWDKQGVSIAYDESRDLIPVKIGGFGEDSSAVLNSFNFSHSDDIIFGSSDGRTSGLSLKDPELVDLILNLLPQDMKKSVRNLDIKMDKFVFLRVLLTYLMNASEHFIK